MKKYEMLLEEKVLKIDGRKLYRIRALKDFGNVKEGDLGGWIESEDNLSHEGSCWITDEARVFDDALICDDAIIRDHAKIYGSSKIHGKSEVSGRAVVYGMAKVCNSKTISGLTTKRTVVYNSRIADRAAVYDLAQVYNGCVDGHAKLYGSAKVLYGQIHDFAEVYGEARITGCTNCIEGFNNCKHYTTAVVSGRAQVYDKAMIFGDARVTGQATVHGKARVYRGGFVTGYADVSGDAEIYATVKGRSTFESNNKVFGFA